MRAYGFILYPESQQDIIDRLLKDEKTNESLLYCVSPLHDKDTNKDGTLKKPHYHVLYNGSKGDIKHIYNGFMLEIQNMQAYEEYLDHSSQGAIEDGKARYNSDDIHYSAHWEDSQPKRADSYLEELCGIVIGNDIQEYCHFAEMLLEQPNKALREYAFKHEAKMKHLIDSRRYSTTETRVTQEDYLKLLKEKVCLKREIEEVRLLYHQQTRDLKELEMYQHEKNALMYMKVNELEDAYERAFGRKFVYSNDVYELQNRMYSEQHENKEKKDIAMAREL